MMLVLSLLAASTAVRGYMTDRSRAAVVTAAAPAENPLDLHPQAGFDAEGGPAFLRRRLACSKCWPWELHKRKCWCSCSNKGNIGDSCSVGCPCVGTYKGQELKCSAGSFVCEPPAVLGETCHATEKCGDGLSCQPGVQKCYHHPRHFKEPCSAGFGCKNGLTCQPGVQKCYHNPRRYEEPCSAGFSCKSGMNCHPAIHKCYNVPRQFNEPCSAGYECGSGMTCPSGLAKDRGGQKCWHNPRLEGEPCNAFNCGDGMKCEKMQFIPEDKKKNAKVTGGSICYYK